MATHVRHEGDLRNMLAGSIERGLDVVPGLRTSAAFFTFLRANLVLPTSTLNSTTSTPNLSPYSSQTLPPLHTLPPSSLSIMSSIPSEPASTIPSASAYPLDGVPDLTTAILSTTEDKTLALKLVADSVAQQRQIASRAMIFHPLTVAIWVLALGLVSRYFYKQADDIGIVLTTCGGATMAGLIAVRGLASGYLSLAEELGWGFLTSEKGNGEEDIVLGSRYGDELIGALVLRLERNPPSPLGSSNGSKRKGSGNNKHGKTGGQGIIRAWTVRMRYRETGVGTGLLEEAVRVTRETLGGSAAVGFAREHANSRMVVPEFFNGVFRRGEKRAALGLERVLAGLDGKKKR
ncbi:hypothetical protein BJ875DRAFT_505581 [Amylocarpus encephaloides]|uniref:Uncharacterized protein n=1 Tax=Amylocarpus encephaloides TaxID=45428 RepID=A0A9P8C4F0_9HELO|nr:hypothetical protein BJ875DRAFT_505581 [Amylocarpus encephaloides]